MAVNLDALLDKAKSSLNGKWNETDANGSTTFAGYCLNYVARLLGQSASGSAVDPKYGVRDAAYAWETYPASLKHPGDLNPPVGSFVWWGRSVAGGYGHVAVVVAPGKIISTHGGNGAKVYNLRDVMSSGYEGWTPPALAVTNYQPVSGWTSTGQSGLSADVLEATKPKQPAKKVTTSQSGIAVADTQTSNPVASAISNAWQLITNPGQAANTALAGTFAALFQPFMFLFLPTTWIRIQAGIAGFILLILGIILLAWEN
jgi:hypothetical protein